MKKKLQNEWKSFHLVTKVTVILISILIVCGLLYALYYFKFRPIIYEENKKEMLTQVEALANKNEEIKKLMSAIPKTIDINFRGHIVRNFEIEKDTLPFKNFGTTSSKGGNCFGFSTFELLVFENSINKYLNKDICLNKKLGEYHLSNYDVKTLYFGKYAENEYNKINSPNEPDYEQEVKLALKLKDNEEENSNHEPYNINQGLDENEISKIVEAISYLQQQQDDKLIKLGFLSIKAEPYYNNSVLSLNNKNTCNKINPNEITNVIDKDKLVVISLSCNSALDGHAVLAYGYQVIDDNNIIVYISDSNFPIIQDSSISFDKYKNDSYMLFTREIDNNCWSYIYEPSYGGYKPYSNFNSFIPGNYLKLHYST